MLTHRFLQTFFIVPVFLAFLAAGAPVPSPQPTQHASSHDPNHGNHVQHAHATSPPAVHAGQTTAHDVGQHGHVTGTVAVHPSKQHAMTPSDLHAHIDHVKTVLAFTHPDHDHQVHASHSPGDTHVRYHAAPPHHVANEHTPGPAQHAVLHPGPQPHDAPHKDGVMTLNQRNAISMGLYNKLIRNQPDGRPGGHPQYNVGYVPGHPGEHGRGIAGTIPIAHDNMRNGMTPGELHMHADWVNRALVGAPHQDKVHVHVTHNPGDNHVSFHATPAQNKDILHPDHQHDTTLNPLQRGQLKNHLNHAGDQHYAAGSITGNNPNQRTFHGTIPAHTNQQMTPAHLDEYAAHAKERLVAKHNIPQHEAANMVVAATHKAGDNTVHFHTQPKTEAFLNHLSNDTQFPQFNQALTNAGHMRGNTGATWHHAELGALRDSLTSKGATAATFDQHINGHVIGVAGAGNQPCAACHNTLAQLPVKYTNMDRDTRPGIQRAV